MIEFTANANSESLTEAETRLSHKVTTSAEATVLIQERLKRGWGLVKHELLRFDMSFYWRVTFTTPSGEKSELLTANWLLEG